MMSALIVSFDAAMGQQCEVDLPVRRQGFPMPERAPDFRAVVLLTADCSRHRRSYS
jgi:hypothetical protein